MNIQQKYRISVKKMRSFGTAAMTTLLGLNQVMGFNFNEVLRTRGVPALSWFNELPDPLLQS